MSEKDEVMWDILAQLTWKAQEVIKLREAVRNLLSEAAPLVWVANQDTMGASEWEKRAAVFLKGLGSA